MCLPATINWDRDYEVPIRGQAQKFYASWGNMTSSPPTLESQGLPCQRVWYTNLYISKTGPQAHTK